MAYTYKFKNTQQRIIFSSLSLFIAVISFLALEWATNFTSMPISKALVVILVGASALVFFQEQLAALMSIKK